MKKIFPKKYFWIILVCLPQAVPIQYILKLPLVWQWLYIIETLYVMLMIIYYVYVVFKYQKSK